MTFTRPMCLFLSLYNTTTADRLLKLRCSIVPQVVHHERQSCKTKKKKEKQRPRSTPIER